MWVSYFIFPLFVYMMILLSSIMGIYQGNIFPSAIFTIVEKLANIVVIKDYDMGFWFVYLFERWLVKYELDLNNVFEAAKCASSIVVQKKIFNKNSSINEIWCER